jgi:hypothetical protein
MLMIVFMNQGVLTLPVDKIKRDLRLTDTEFSLASIASGLAHGPGASLDYS